MARDRSKCSCWRSNLGRRMTVPSCPVHGTGAPKREDPLVRDQGVEATRRAFRDLLTRR